ncbi:MAG: DNA-deoxyinosine glycosylase [Succinivibrio sp.]|nr:DNA-deoxyinosine glycosylase [Succinivibrio sp.]
MSAGEIKNKGEVLFGLPPFVPEAPRLLILGSMPSEASLEAGFYYAHPRNRFFKILGDYAGQSAQSVSERQALLCRLRIALFDVIASCRRQGSLDSAIRDPVPNDIALFLKEHPGVKAVITNGGLSKKLFLKYNKVLGIKIIHLPSTSPANAGWPLKRLESEYFKALDETLA